MDGVVAVIVIKSLTENLNRGVSVVRNFDQGSRTKNFNTNFHNSIGTV